MVHALKHNFFPPPAAADLKDTNNAQYPEAVEYNSTITLEQIRRAVRKTAPNKAPGPDGITNKVLKQAMPKIEKRLQCILQASVNLSYFPKALKQTTTVVLRKPGKPDYTKAKAYRPITLESTIGKVFESVMAEMLSYLTETNELLPAHHYGGRPGRSTEDALMILQENIYKAWKEKKIFTAIFLDVAGAFNNVHHKRLIHNLQTRRVPRNIAKWMESFLQGRSTKLQFNGAKSEPINTPAGVPQGSPLSPLLYMYYNADLLDIGTKRNDIALGFIDDIVYGTAGTSDLANVRRLKTTLNQAEEWRRKHGAQFEQSKYVLVHFTRNYRKSTKASVQTGGITVEPSEEAKYLGVIFDKQLRFKAHLQYAVRKGTTAALGLSSIGKSTWGAPFRYIRQLFQSVVTTRLDYAAIIWHRPRPDGSAAASVQARKLTTVQRLGMKAILGCHHTTPTVAMEVESGIQPTWLRLQTKVLTAATRMQFLDNKHPIKQWLAKARKKTRNQRAKIKYLSNLENIAQQFRTILKRPNKEIKPFEQAPWENEQARRTGRANERAKQEQIQQVKKLARDTWEAIWTDAKQNKLAPGKHLQRIIGDNITGGPEIYKSMKHRQSATTLVRLRTGHCGLNQYLARFKKIDSPRCTYCGYETETVEHFLLECPNHWRARDTMRKRVGARQMELRSLLGDRKLVSVTLEFVEASGRFAEG